MDWPAIASILAERGDRPLAVLDRGGRIRLFNRAMEDVLGWSRFQVDGREWAAVCAPAESQPAEERWVAEALRGALGGCEVTAQTKAGGLVAFRFEFAVVGRGASQGLVMLALESRPVQTGEGCRLGMDLDYEISVVGPDFGSLMRLCSIGERVPIAGGHVHCYALLHGQQQPCEDCPVLRMSSAPWPRILVRPSTKQTTTEPPTFQVVTAEALSATHVRVKVRNISESTLDAIQQAKVERLAAQANLSPREREVLGYLLLGRSIEDMAKLVGISPRTVKHHQASALEKLGADSRADLMRLIF